MSTRQTKLRHSTGQSLAQKRRRDSYDNDELEPKQVETPSHVQEPVVFLSASPLQIMNESRIIGSASSGFMLENSPVTYRQLQHTQ